MWMREMADPGEFSPLFKGPVQWVMRGFLSFAAQKITFYTSHVSLPLWLFQP